MMGRNSLLAFAALSTVGCASSRVHQDAPTDRQQQVRDFFASTGARKCEAKPVQHFIGQKASQALAADALAQSGARTLRWAAPRTAMTMDYRTDRLNIFYDDAMVVTKLSCS